MIIQFALLYHIQMWYSIDTKRPTMPVRECLEERTPWASYQIPKIAGCACAGNAGNVFPRRRFQRKPLVNDPDMHHGTCVTHVMHVGIAHLRWRGKHSRHSRCMRTRNFVYLARGPLCHIRFQEKPINKLILSYAPRSLKTRKLLSLMAVVNAWVPSVLCLLFEDK